MVDVPFTSHISIHCSELILVMNPLFTQREPRQSIRICWTRSRLIPHLKRNVSEYVLLSCLIYLPKSWRSSAQWFRNIKPCPRWGSQCWAAYSPHLPHTHIHPVTKPEHSLRNGTQLSRSKESLTKANKKAQLGSKTFGASFLTPLHNGSKQT